MEEPAHALSVGSVVGGSTPTNRPWRDAIRELTRRAAKAREGIEAPLNVNVVFHVPGNLLSPEFVGVRTGSFSKSRRLLMVQVALSSEVPSDVLGHLRAAVLAAIDEAERWAYQRKIEGDFSTLREVASAA